MSLSKVNLTKLGRAQRRHSQEQHARKRIFASIVIPWSTDPIHYFSPRNYTSKKFKICKQFWRLPQSLRRPEETNDDWAVHAFQIFFHSSNMRSDNSPPFFQAAYIHSCLRRKKGERMMSQAKVLINGEVVIKWGYSAANTG